MRLIYIYIYTPRSLIIVFFYFFSACNLKSEALRKTACRNLDSESLRNALRAHKRETPALKRTAPTWCHVKTTYLDKIWITDQKTGCLQALRIGIPSGNVAGCHGKLSENCPFKMIFPLKMVNVLLILTPKKAGLLGIPWTYWWCQLTQAKCTSGCKAKTQHNPPNKIIWYNLRVFANANP